MNPECLGPGRVAHSLLVSWSSFPAGGLGQRGLSSGRKRSVSSADLGRSGPFLTVVAPVAPSCVLRLSSCLWWALGLPRDRGCSASFSLAGDLGKHSGIARETFVEQY